MKRHKIVVELSTDDDNIARLYHSINNSGKLSELVEKLIFLQMNNYYDEDVSNNNIKQINTNSDMAERLNALTSAITELQNKVGNAVVIPNLNEMIASHHNVEQVAATTVEVEEVEIEIVQKAPQKRKGKRDLSKLKKLKG